MTIHCTDDCIYQREGECTLTHATSVSETSSDKGCGYYKPKATGTNITKI